MKILTFKYNRQASAICTSTLMADEEYAGKDMYRLAARPEKNVSTSRPRPEKNTGKHVISGTWQ